MTSSTNHRKPDKVIATVLALLNEDYLTWLIDDPIQKAFSEFDYEASESGTYFHFVETTSRLFCAICKQVGAPMGWMSHSRTQQEVMDLLERNYHTPHGGGFQFAYIDAIEDLDSVLMRIAGIAISTLRGRHVQWVHFKWITGLSWSDKCTLVSALFDNNPALPAKIKKCPPPQLADHVFDLMSTIVNSDASVRSSMKGDLTTEIEDSFLPHTIAEPRVIPAIQRGHNHGMR